MEIKSIFGVPAHPLLVHLPVVFIPLAFIGAVIIVASSRLRPHFSWLVAAFAAIGTFGAIVAASTGETLQSQVKDSTALHDHVQLGESARMFAMLFFVAIAAYVGIDFLVRRVRNGQPIPERLQKLAVARLVTPLAALSLLTGAIAFARVAQAGHQGAKVSWSTVTAEAQAKG
jgi:uncharacterized membrane protein